MVNLKERKRLINMKFTTVVALRSVRGMGLGRGTEALQSQR